MMMTHEQHAPSTKVDLLASRDVCPAVIHSSTNFFKSTAINTIMSPHPVNTTSNTRQVQNRAGGFVYELSDIERVKRFLILGSDTNTFYASAKVTPRQSA